MPKFKALQKAFIFGRLIAEGEVIELADAEPGYLLELVDEEVQEAEPAEASAPKRSRKPKE